MKHETASNLTKQAFADALKKKMREKKLSKITVTDLICECGLNRKTFYYHFRDINELVKWLLKRELLGLVAQFDVTSEIKDIIHCVIRYINQNHYICACIFESEGYMDIKEFLRQEFHEPVMAAVNRYSAHEDIPLDYKEFLVDFYTEALSGILISYTRKTSEISEVRLEKKIDYLNHFLQCSLPYMLNEQGFFL